MQTKQPSMSSGDVTGRGAVLECAPFGQATRDRNIEFQSLLARELPRFQRMAMRCLRNREDAEDAVQDAVLSAFTHIASFQGRARMSSWLMSIVLNSARMHLRRNRRSLLPFDHVSQGESVADVETLRDPRPNPEQSCQYTELCGILADSMNRLSKAQRAALELYSLKGLSLKEAAGTLGIPVGTLKAQLARGRVRLSQKTRRLAATSGPLSPHIGAGERSRAAGRLRVATNNQNSFSRPYKPAWSGNRGRRGSSSVPA
jgi:RNA polymerase sigma-70 factor (ECF subfamily)